MTNSVRIKTLDGLVPHSLHWHQHAHGILTNRLEAPPPETKTLSQNNPGTNGIPASFTVDKNALVVSI